jgi:hypothetical protein
MRGLTFAEAIVRATDPAVEIIDHFGFVLPN